MSNNIVLHNQTISQYLREQAQTGTNTVNPPKMVERRVFNWPINANLRRQLLGVTQRIEGLEDPYRMDSSYKADGLRGVQPDLRIGDKMRRRLARMMRDLYSLYGAYSEGETNI